jgi:FkbM family methyltransferase
LAALGGIPRCPAAWGSGQFPASPSPELQSLASRYGPHRNSEHAEEWIIRDFFRDRPAGTFVDVGANDYRAFSNTYYLEAQLGWSGIAIEPQRQFESGYSKYRPRTKFRSFFVSDASNKQAKLYVQARNKLVTSADHEFNERYGHETEEIVAPTITLDDLLAAEHVATIDFVTMDIELWEPKALAGFDIERFRPALICVEAHPEVRQQILDYFAAHHYTIVGKYLRADTENLYFTPLKGPEESARQLTESMGARAGNAPSRRADPAGRR